MRTLLFLALCGVVSNCSASEWTGFRGATGNGYVDQSGLPLEWDKTTNVAWSKPIPGGGWSSPVSANGHIFVTTAVAKGMKPRGFGAGVASMMLFKFESAPKDPINFEVHCLRLSDGEEVWKKTIVSRKPSFKIHPSNSYATESPVTDGEHVYAYFAAIGVVACLDLQGNEIWQRDLGAYPTANDFGTGSSLALLGNQLFVQCDNQKSSFVCALNTATGDDVWRVERSGKTSWSSPVVWQNSVRDELVVCGAGSVVSYDPASGGELWRLTGTGGAFSASPTFDKDRIYLGNSGRNSRGPLMAIKAGASGELKADSVSDNGLVWSERSSAPGMSSPVVVDGYLYVLSRGVLSCHEAATGKRLFRKRLPGAASIAASLWAAGDKVFILDEAGRTFVIEVGNKYKLLGTNQIEGLYWSTPSVVGNSLLLRSAEGIHLVQASGSQSES